MKKLFVLVVLAVATIILVTGDWGAHDTDVAPGFKNEARGVRL